MSAAGPRGEKSVLARQRAQRAYPGGAPLMLMLLARNVPSAAGVPAARTRVPGTSASSVAGTGLKTSVADGTLISKRWPAALSTSFEPSKDSITELVIRLP